MNSKYQMEFSIWPISIKQQKKS